MEAYVALIDSPVVLSAAARHLELTNETAEEVGDGHFELRSPTGSRASYRVIWQDQTHRIILSQGSLALFGGVTVDASVVGVLTLSSPDGAVQQDLKVFVRVDNKVLSWLARVAGAAGEGGSGMGLARPASIL